MDPDECRNSIWKEFERMRINRRWTVGILAPILTALLLALGATQIQVWAATGKNTEDVGEMKAKIRATQQTVYRIAIKLGVEPVVEDGGSE